MELILSLLVKFGPAIVVALTALGMYFGIKRKGVREERERQEVRQAEAVKRVEAKVDKAVARDDLVDQKTAEKVKEIEAKNTPEPGKPDNDTRFRF